MSEFLDKLMKEADDFRWNEGPDIPDQTNEQSVQHDSFDDLSYDMLKQQIPALPKSIKNVANEYDYVNPAYADLFNLLHSGDPEFEDVRSMKDGYDANHEMFGNMHGTPEFDELRKETAYDEYATAFTMLSMEDDMKEAFRQTKEAREARTEAMEALQQALEDLQVAQEQGQQAQQPGCTLTQVQAAQQSLQQTLAQAQAAAAAVAAAQAAQSQAAAQAAQQLQNSAHAAGQELKADEEQAGGYGIGPGELKMMPFEERQALTRKLNHGKMKKLANLIGQFREYADAERRRKVKIVPQENFSVELGRDLNRLLPDEFNRLAIPETEDLFWLRYASSSLMQWVKHGPGNMGKGPILLVCDESGSMGCVVDADGNTREMWSKAIGIALADQARRGKRDFTYIGFSSGGQHWQLDFPGGETPIDKLQQFVEHFYCGGTEYTGPLGRAMNLIEEAAANGRPKPDIVFVTDDDCSVPPEFVETFREAREKFGVTVYGIQIGGSALRNTMPQLCDKTIDLSQVNSNPEGMTELFRGI
jgi:uncharacterized protein with von Willebrand factor type A (vWA) domain